MNIRTAAMEDLEAISELEAKCFPAGEAASKEDLEKRLSVYPDHFWLLEDGDALVGFIDGMATEQADLTDEMYQNAALHEEDGSWQMIFGVGVVFEYRRRGCAGKLLEHVIGEAKSRGRSGLVLTCKEKLLRYYARFGFQNEGISESCHGGAVWYQMRLRF